LNVYVDDDGTYYVGSDTIVFNVGILGIGEGNKDEIFGPLSNPIATGTVSVPFTNGVGSGVFQETH